MNIAHYAISDPTDGVWTQLASNQDLQDRLETLPADQQPITMAVKANIGVAGMARSAGNKALEAHRQVVDAPVVAALHNAGYLPVGTSNMHELAFGITSENTDYGPVQLPGHPERCAGGSSGGSAVAVAEGTVDVALGTDTGGSVSIPASHCGVYGLRPTTGRWPGAEITGLSWTRDTAGAFATSIAQLRHMDAVITGQYERTAQAPQRIGVPIQFMQQLAKHTKNTVTRALETLGEFLTVVEVDFSGLLELVAPTEMPVVLWESRQILAGIAAEVFNMTPQAGLEYLLEHVSSTDVVALLQAELADPVSLADYAAAQHGVIQARAYYDQLLADHNVDALVFPATAAPAPVLGSNGVVEHLGEPTAIFPLYTRHTGQGTMLSAPMVTIPLPVAHGELPVGLTIQGARHTDQQLLTTADYFQRLLTPAST